MPDLPSSTYAVILTPMGNRCSLIQTDSPRPTYRVIDRRRDAGPALHPATLPSGAPHPLVGQPRPEVPRKLTVSPSDGLSPAPRYLHLGTGASVRLRPCGSLSPPHPAPLAHEAVQASLTA